MVDSTLHPDTGEAILLPFRMSCFVPTNMILVLGMLTPNPTVCCQGFSFYNFFLFSQMIKLTPDLIPLFFNMAIWIIDVT